jgi:hypothetical protein
MPLHVVYTDQCKYCIFIIYKKANTIEASILAADYISAKISKQDAVVAKHEAFAVIKEPVPTGNNTKQHQNHNVSEK